MQVETRGRELVVGEAERGRLVGLCTALTRDRDAAEDLAQETLLQAWRIRHRLQDPAGRDRWLAAIARNVCRRWARSRGRELAVAAAVVPDATAAGDLEVELEREELAELLDRALGLLPAETRDVLVLRYVHESTHAAIGERLGISEDAVSMRLSRGKVVLRRVLAEELGDHAASHGLVAPDAGWRPTRVWCPVCGSRRLSMLHEPPPGAVSFRCPGCSARRLGSLSSRFSFANPVLGRLLGHLVRPTAILGRAADWQADLYLAGSRAGRVECAGCGAAVPLVPYRRPELPAGHANGHGLVAQCGLCGETSFCSSLAGITLALPAVRAVLGAHPRTRVLPLREVERGGEPAVVVRVEDVRGPAAVDAVFARRGFRLLHLATTG